MQSYLVANPKGGVGKSTLATNLAGMFACAGQKVMLGDIDRQQSSRDWLQLRPASLPRIHSWDIEEGKPARPPADATHVILDTPAGLHGKKLSHVLKLVQRVIVPLQPSIFDILATEEFLKRIRSHEARVNIGVIGMRVNARTRAADQLAHYVAQLGLPVLGYLRDTQNYIQLAAHGATLWDVAPSKVEKDIAQWNELLKWIKK